MCLAADIPLIESGTAGYLGQVTVIKKVALIYFHTENQQFGCMSLSSFYIVCKVAKNPKGNGGQTKIHQGPWFWSVLQIFEQGRWTCLFSAASYPGNDRVLRVPAKTSTEDLPRMHHKKHTIWAHSLHRLGQISLQVSRVLFTHAFLGFKLHLIAVCVLV